MTDETEAERIATLFLGSELGYGTYRQEEKTPGKVKTEIKKTAQTVRGPTTKELWEKHLSGERSLGIIPIREDGMCYWGVIDVDMYDLSHRDVANKVKKLGLPLVLCKSKSGGAHLFVFVSSPVASSDMMSKMREFAALMGYGSSEVFPKQTSVNKDKDLGNWLNMPYFNAAKGTRYGVDAEGRGMSLRKFLEIAENAQLTATQFLDFKPKAPESAPDFGDGPPCLQHLSAIGVDEGGRNNALFAFGVLAKKMKPDAWETLLESWNQKHINPPLTSDEVQIVIKSLRKKDYTYKCKEPPIMNHCDQPLCRTRRFGIGAGAMPSIVSITTYNSDPPLYLVTLEDGTSIECKIDDILSSRMFQRTVLMQSRQLLPLYKQDNFLKKIGELLEHGAVIDVPVEVSTKGHFELLLQEFLTDQYAAQTRDEVLLGKPWLDEETSLYWFRLDDLMKFLDKEKFKEYNRGQITKRIRDMDGDNKFVHLARRGVNLWFLPSANLEIQQESFVTPRVKDSPV